MTTLAIRGTSGSGKTYIAYGLLSKFGIAKEILGPDGKVWAYRLRECPERTYLIGRYGTSGGGTDILPKKGAEFFKFLRNLSRKGNVVFEGFILAKTTGRFIDFAKYQNLIIGCLDTPLNICIERVMKRRKQRESEEFTYSRGPFDPSKTVRPGFYSTWTSSQTLKEEGVDVRIIPYKKSLSTVLGWLYSDY